jgi:hypothetical protein
LRAHPRWLALAISLLPAASLATDGVIELSHAKALAGDATLSPPDDPGYPIEIRTPGSYRLTSDLTPTGEDAIVLKADLVNLDLNGFAIRGGEQCAPGACSPGTGMSGVIGDRRGPGGAFVTIRNGDVSGFGSTCIVLGGGSRVENVRVLACGGQGIELGPSSAAFANYVANTGVSSLTFRGGGIFRDNVMESAGLNVASPTIVGGTATGGNLCDDGRCSRRGWRRYYLTKNLADGLQALNACASGFHMASRWELDDPSSLEYDPILGRQNNDSGQGPPVGNEFGEQVGGWVRTGSVSMDLGFGVMTNCDTWSTNDGSSVGTFLSIDVNWNTAGTALGTPWIAGSGACNSSIAVWCIED